MQLTFLACKRQWVPFPAHKDIGINWPVEQKMFLVLELNFYYLRKLTFLCIPQNSVLFSINYKIKNYLILSISTYHFHLKKFILRAIREMEKGKHTPTYMTMYVSLVAQLY